MKAVYACTLPAAGGGGGALQRRWRRRYGRCRLYGQAAGTLPAAAAATAALQRRRRLSRNRMSAPQDCPIRTILLMTTFQGHVALHRRNVNKRRVGHSMTTWTIFLSFFDHLFVDFFYFEPDTKTETQIGK